MIRWMAPHQLSYPLEKMKVLCFIVKLTCLHSDGGQTKAEAEKPFPFSMFLLFLCEFDCPGRVEPLFNSP